MLNGFLHGGLSQDHYSQLAVHGEQAEVELKQATQTKKTQELSGMWVQMQMMLIQ